MISLRAAVTYYIYAPLPLLIRLVYDKNTSPYRFAFKFGVKFKAELVFFRCGKISKFAIPAATFSAMKFNPSQVAVQARKGEIYAKIGANKRGKMPKLKFIFALVAAFVFSGCYETTLLARVPISTLVSDKGADVKSALALTNVTPQTHDEKVVTDNVRVFVPDAKFKDFPTGQTAYEMNVSVGRGEKGGKNSDKRAVRIYLDEFGGVYGRLSKNVLEQYAGAAKQGEAPKLKAGIKFENDTKAIYELVVGNEFKASDEAQTGGVYALGPGQVTGAIWADSTAVREAVAGKAVKIGTLKKAAK